MFGWAPSQRFFYDPHLLLLLLLQKYPLEISVENWMKRRQHPNVSLNVKYLARESRFPFQWMHCGALEFQHPFIQNVSPLCSLKVQYFPSTIFRALLLVMFKLSSEAAISDPIIQNKSIDYALMNGFCKLQKGSILTAVYKKINAYEHLNIFKVSWV